MRIKMGTKTSKYARRDLTIKHRHKDGGIVFRNEKRGSKASWRRLLNETCANLAAERLRNKRRGFKIVQMYV